MTLREPLNEFCSFSNYMHGASVLSQKQWSVWDIVYFLSLKSIGKSKNAHKMLQQASVKRGKGLSSSKRQEKLLWSQQLSRKWLCDCILTTKCPVVGIFQDPKDTLILAAQPSFLFPSDTAFSLSSGAKSHPNIYCEL